ncbi:hypothetical protein [Vibrio parahaemolyticus]|uniref:hypothetical protein n=1 Tax=Vibrio parahaemolyticus TaxID=670 RepID=UPI00226B3B0C|nr:hypothetical protein [Vibrio parahaemolyticus]MCX8941255.1 hypothetical protein [Vibrio parahaemolyticus]
MQKSYEGNGKLTDVQITTVKAIKNLAFQNAEDKNKAMETVLVAICQMAEDMGVARVAMENNSYRILIDPIDPMRGMVNELMSIMPDDLKKKIMEKVDKGECNCELCQSRRANKPSSQ